MIDYLHIDAVIDSMGHDSKIFITNSFLEDCSYLNKKKDEFGLHATHNKYDVAKFVEIKNIIDSFAPDVLFFIDLPTKILTFERFQEIVKLCKNKGTAIVVFFVNTLKDRTSALKYLSLCNVVVSFDQEDVNYLEKILAVPTFYSPVGYSEECELTKFDPQISRPIDVSFIGSAWKFRLKILEALSNYSINNGKVCRIFGPMIDVKYFWKLPLFKLKFPNLSQCLVNRSVSLLEAGEICSKSKICINLHLGEQSSPNPRTFLILASGALQLIDERLHYSGLTLGVDLVKFNGIENLIELVDYFLNHDEDRTAIARNGWRKVVPKFRLSNCLEKIFGVAKMRE